MRRESGKEKEIKREKGIERMREYYGPIFADAEEIIEKLKEPLPSTFRVTSGPWRKYIEEELKAFKLVRNVPWGAGIYEISLSRQELRTKAVEENIRQIEKEELSKTKEFLQIYSESSEITRQELVSMIPVMALDVEKNSIVLDMCASPGSKSSQILEALGEEGVLVANDVNSRRVDQLVKQTKRFGSPGLVVTCNDGTAYPRIGISPNRVLCDVPCSGDGTIRKNKHIFENWEMKEALNLFHVQKKILKRGLDILEKGGILVYSTCSLNPIENEMIVLSALNTRTDIEMLHFEIDGLVMREGLSSEQLEQAAKSIPQDKKIEYVYDEQVKACRRVLPNDQNTGGFFIAKIRKTEGKPIEYPKAEKNQFIRGEKGIEESLLYRANPEKEKYILSQWGTTCLSLVCKSEQSKKLYAVNQKALQILENAPEPLRVTYSGVRLFSIYGKSTNDENERWRVSYEGSKHCAVKEEKSISLSIKDLLVLLEGENPAMLEETTKRIMKDKKGIFLLRAEEKKESFILQVPITYYGDKIEILIEKYQKQALIHSLRIVIAQIFK
ncbi:tRNA (cytosine34-C5)-methyltransferase [Nematocida sp. LUAm3]|nr:tRNA (cytosine34-C5)-methyltransferase [Nematocida sp. LUAm3]